MIMSTVLTEKTPAEPPWAGFLNKMQETLSALLARRLRRRAAELIVVHDRMLENVGLDRREIGSVLMDDTQERTNCGRQQRWHVVSRDSPLHLQNSGIRDRRATPSCAGGIRPCRQQDRATQGQQPTHNTGD